MTKEPTTFTGAHGLASAPLQFKGTFHFEASREVLWPVLTDAKEIAKWFPLVSGGKFDHRDSVVPQACGVGSKRFCQTIGMGILDETIHFWDPPRQVGYEVRNMMMPIKDHLSIMTLSDDEGGGTQFVWEQYFSYKGLIMRHVFPTMMLTMMNRGMETLRKRYGGGGGEMQRVSLGKLA